MKKILTDQAYMARTAAGQSHGNRLVVRRLKTVVVFLDIPHCPSDLRDRFRLVSQNGEYDRTLCRSEAIRQDEKRMLLLFTEVPPLPTYSLYHAVTAEIEVPVFLDVPFAELPDHGPEGSATAWREPNKPLSGEPPRFALEDPLVHADVADCRLDSTQYLDLIACRTPASGTAPGLA